MYKLYEEKEFFWIFVVLVAVLLFFVMGRTVEGFFWSMYGDCPGGITTFCKTCYKPDGKTAPSTCINPPNCGCPNGSSITKPATKNKTPACSSNNYLNGTSCAAVA